MLYLLTTREFTAAPVYIAEGQTLTDKANDAITFTRPETKVLEYYRKIMNLDLKFEPKPETTK